MNPNDVATLTSGFAVGHQFYKSLADTWSSRNCLAKVSALKILETMTDSRCNTSAQLECFGAHQRVITNFKQQGLLYDAKNRD